jgi:subtilisin family serine protease
VLGVGAVDEAGVRLSGSQIGPHVDLVAPGGGALAATRAGGHQYWQGTSFAAPFVAATAALVRSAWPRLNAAEVAARILATATPAPGGRGSAAYGAGLVNPFRAVTDGLDSSALAVVPPLRVSTPPPAPPSLPALRILGIAVAVVAVLPLMALVAIRGRRAGWRVRRAAAPLDRPAAVDLPDRLF